VLTAEHPAIKLAAKQDAAKIFLFILFSKDIENKQIKKTRYAYFQIAFLFLLARI
tara:strand:- start:2230 stop:2394 length:165 start_codon:yes stop_codon:yes gene_type:complete